MPVETGGREDHVRRTRSLSRRALGGDRDPGRLYWLRPCCAHPRHAGREPSRVAGRRRILSVRSASGPCISSACWPRRLPADSVYLVLPDDHFVSDLRAGGRHIAVLRQHRRTPRMLRVVSSAVLLGLGIVSMHYVGMHGLAGNFAIEHDDRDGRALGRDRDRRGLWRPAGVPRPAGRHPADR